MSVLQWEKKGLVFGPQQLENRPEWMQEFAQAPCTLIFDDFVRVFFNCRPKPNEQGQYVSYCGFVDLDRKNLRKVKAISEEPVLPLGDLGCFDEFGTYPLSVVRNGEKLWAYYGGWTRCESVPFDVAIGCAISDNDGVSFKKLGKGPVLSYSLEEPFLIGGPKIRKYNDLFYLFYIAGTEWILDNGKPEPIYKIRSAVSEDGISWKRSNKQLIQGNPREAQACPDVIYQNGKYHMFFCYRGAEDYRRNPRNTYRIGYAWSENLIDWVREDEKVGIDISETGFDSEMVAYPHIFELDGKIYMFYLGNEVGRQGFGLAELKGELK